MKRICSMLLAFGVALAMAQSASAQVYRWVDDEGKVHFTDQPPPGEDVERVDVKTSKSSVSGEEVAEQRRAQLEALQSEREAREKARADAASERRERKEKCEAARERYNNVVWKKKIHEIDEQGNKTYLSDADEDRVKREAADAVSEFCN